MDNPFSGGPFGGNPVNGEGQAVVCCPKCQSQNFRAWTNQWGLFRKCLEKECGEQWSGGTMASGRSNFNQLYPQPLPNVPAPDDDYPVVQYTGAGYRNPDKTFGDDDF